MLSRDSRVGARALPDPSFVRRKKIVQNPNEFDEAGISLKIARREVHLDAEKRIPLTLQAVREGRPTPPQAGSRGRK
jgi:hypothetical protein